MSREPTRGVEWQRERCMSLLAQVSMALDEWNADPNSQRAEENLVERLDAIIGDARRVFDLDAEVERVREEGA